MTPIVGGALALFGELLQCSYKAERNYECSSKTILQKSK